jgi:hypothetical protein
MRLVVFLLFFICNFAYSDTFSNHMISISGLEQSIKDANKGLAANREKLKKAKSLDERQMIDADIKALESSLVLYKKAIKDTEKHLKLEHTEKDRKLYEKFRREKLTKKAEK